MRLLKSTRVACAAMLLLSACTHDTRSYRPGFDVVASHPQQPYEADLGLCRHFANEQVPATGKAAAGAVAGGMAGATAGAVLGAFTIGGPVWGAIAGARAGATRGADSLDPDGAAAQRSLINDCMRGRGWAVL